MRDFPIIFSGPMVLALLAGRKTQTRRLAWTVRQKCRRCDKPMKALEMECVCGSRVGVETSKPSIWQKVRGGDRLWVKEAVGFTADHMSFFYEADKTCLLDSQIARLRQREIERGEPYKNLGGRYVPRFTSRLTLTVTAGKIEKVQSISPQDAWDEGVERRSRQVRQFWLIGAAAMEREAIYKRACVWEYEALWKKLHGAESWEANPEVVALTFAVEKKNVDAPLAA